MTCYQPLQGWRGRLDGRVVFNRAAGYADKPVAVPCGRCIGCRLARADAWAVRMMHEAQMHELSCFLTLTYADEFLPPFGSLRFSDFQKFMKRYRTRVAPSRFKFFHCGEYGEALSRPHYHAVILGHDFLDKEYFKSVNGNRYFVSELLSDLWPFGTHLIGTVTFGSCKYVACYITKKFTGDGAQKHYEVVDPVTGEIGFRDPEYATMSNGIGKSWFMKYGFEVFNGGQSDDVVIDARGRKVKPPRYYFELLKRDREIDAIRTRGRRVRRAKENAHDATVERLKVREKVVKARRKTYSKRSYEDGT